MTESSLDISRRHDFWVRAGEAIDKVIPVIDSNGDDFDFLDYSGGTLLVYNTTDGKRPVKGSNPVMTFEYGIGLVITDGSIQLVDEEEVDLTRDQYIYFLWLENSSGVKLWLNGLFKINHGLFDGVESDDTLIIRLNGDDVTIQIPALDLTGTKILDALTDADIGQLYLLLLPYINGYVLPGGPSDYIGTLYERLLPYINQELEP